jgi:hypothetical protein
MPLTGAEKQRRYIQRLKAAAAASPQAPPDSEEVIRLRQEVARLEQELEAVRKPVTNGKAEAALAEAKALIDGANEAMADRLWRMGQAMAVHLEDGASVREVGRMFDISPDAVGALGKWLKGSDALIKLAASGWAVLTWNNQNPPRRTVEWWPPGRRPTERDLHESALAAGNRLPVTNRRSKQP